MLRSYYSYLLPFYVLLLLYMMLFGMGRLAGEVGNLQLRPFHSIRFFFIADVTFGRFFINIICNIAVFIPFGWLGLSFKPLRSIWILLPVFVMGIMGVELIQHFSGRGTADIDDVMLNTLGMLTGFVFLQAFKKKLMETERGNLEKLLLFNH